MSPVVEPARPCFAACSTTHNEDTDRRIIIYACGVVFEPQIEPFQAVSVVPGWDYKDSSSNVKVRVFSVLLSSVRT